MGMHMGTKYAAPAVAAGGYNKKRILLVEDRVPYPSYGAGYPRSYEMLNVLLDNGYRVTVFPTIFQELNQEFGEELRKKEVEVVCRKGAFDLAYAAFLRKHRAPFDIIIISRPHNMRAVYRTTKRLCPKARIIYDAEAVFSIREIQELEIRKGYKVNERIRQKLLRYEIDLIRKGDMVFAVSNADKDMFYGEGAKKVIVVSHSIVPVFSKTPFNSRNNLLFVGQIGRRSPNEDSLLYFINDILPLIQKSIKTELFIVGEMLSDLILQISSPSIKITGRVPDVTPFYENCKVFIAPTRFASGIPLKVVEAAAHGIPAVVTPLIASQLQWNRDSEVLVGDTPKMFAEKCIQLLSNEKLWDTIRRNAFNRAAHDYGRDSFEKTLINAIEQG
jgi:O-antigen biosynthesis protein